MKSILFLLFSSLAMVSGFTVVVNQPTSSRTSLEASRSRDKIATRTKWLEKRGFADGVTATLDVEAEVVEAQAESAEEDEAQTQEGETDAEESKE